MLLCVLLSLHLGDSNEYPATMYIFICKSSSLTKAQIAMLFGGGRVE